MDKSSEVSGAIGEALTKLAKGDKASSKDGVDLVEIAKKLSARKFGKK